MSEPIPGVHSDPEILGGTPVFVGTRVKYGPCWTTWNATDRWSSFSTTFRPSIEHWLWESWST